MENFLSQKCFEFDSNLQEYRLKIPNRLLSVCGIVLYKGILFRGMKFGFGREYDYEGNLRYEGLFYKDSKLGLNCDVFRGTGSLEYQGGMFGGRKEGYGKMFHDNGQIYFEGVF